MLASKLAVSKTEKPVLGRGGGSQTLRIVQLRAADAEIWDGVFLDVQLKIVLVPVDGVSL